MTTTLQDTLDFCQPFIGYSPIAAGASLNPAVSIANMIQSTVCSAPFTWYWNRTEDSSLTTSIGEQDYDVDLTDFSFLEKVSLTAPNGSIFEVKDVYNEAALAESSAEQRPTSVSVMDVTYGSSISLRFLGVPNDEYVVTLTYQKLPAVFAALNDQWLLPDSYSDIFNVLFLAEALELFGDMQGSSYRRRGVAALLSKAQGLSEMQRNAFWNQYLARDIQAGIADARTLQGYAAREI